MEANPQSPEANPQPPEATFPTLPPEIDELNLPCKHGCPEGALECSRCQAAAYEKTRYFRSKVVQLKLVTILLGIIVIGLGYSGHNNIWKDTWENDWQFRKDCREGRLLHFERCPSYAIIMEEFFLAFNILCLLLSIYSIAKIAGAAEYGDIVKDDMKGVDRTFQAVSGLLACAAGLLIIIAGVNIKDNACRNDRFIFNITVSRKILRVTANTTTIHPVVTSFCGHESSFKLNQKVAAGVLSALNGVIYFVIAGMLNDRTKGLLGSFQSRDSLASLAEGFGLMKTNSTDKMPPNNPKGYPLQGVQPKDKEMPHPPV